MKREKKVVVNNVREVEEVEIIHLPPPPGCLDGTMLFPLVVRRRVLRITTREGERLTIYPREGLDIKPGYVLTLERAGIFGREDAIDESGKSYKIVRVDKGW